MNPAPGWVVVTAKDSASSRFDARDLTAAQRVTMGLEDGLAVGDFFANVGDGALTMSAGDKYRPLTFVTLADITAYDLTLEQPLIDNNRARG